MEDQHVNDITSKPPKSCQVEGIQDTTALLIFSKWSELPPNVLEKIYSYLDRKDRSQMSLVCRKWCQEYSAPCLWRTMQVFLPQISHSGNVCQAVRYTQKYGHALRHVEIVTKSVRSLREANLMENQLKEFLEALTSFSQLSSVSFQFMLFIYNRKEAYKDILPKLVSFLLSQKKIESIAFRECTFRRLEALEILSAIFARGSGTLKRLALTSFSYEVSPDDFRMYVIDMPSTYEILMNLRKIEIHYSQLETLITSCHEYGITRDLPNKMGALEEILIYCDDDRRNHHQGIPLDAWKHFTKKCPCLKINLYYFTIFEDEGSFEIFIVRHMPVKLLNFHGEINHELYNETGTCRLFSHLLSCETNIYLEEMNIYHLKNTKNFHSDLINFLQTCPRLSEIGLWLKHPVEALDMMFNSLLNNRPPSLERIYITIRDTLTKEDESYYSNISDYFAPLLLAKNLMLYLRIVLVIQEWRKQIL